MKEMIVLNRMFLIELNERFHSMERILVQNNLADAVNSTIVSSGQPVKGYLITPHSFYLVLEDGELSQELFLEALGQSLIEILIQLLPENDKNLFVGNQTDLFSIHPCFDPLLMDLLIGNDRILEYYDPAFTFMKDIVSTSTYSSFQDYKGKVGPVLLNFIPDWF